jgi:chemotaxis protein MotB
MIRVALRAVTGSRFARTGVCLVVASSFALAGCVSQGKFDAAVKDAQSARANAAKQATDDRARIAALEKQISDLETDLKKAQDALAERGKSLDDETVQNAELRAELQRLGKNVDKLLADKGTLSSALDQAKTRLDELRKAQVAADARTALFRELALKFQKMIDAGQLKVVLRNGRMVIQLANDVLFDSGQTDIKPGGQQALAQIASVLASLQDRQFQVAGHTDNVPIQTSQFGSNWELSTARAVEVVRVRVAPGVTPEEMSAAGYGEFDPIASNDSAGSRAKNRRIEITLQPNIDELVAVPGVK